MISFNHVYKTFPGPSHALRDVSLQVDKGEFLFLTGPSGAGKTTLFRMISAFDRPSSGQVTVAGYDMNRLNAEQAPHFRRKIGVVFQDFRLLTGRSVFENVALPLEVRFDKTQYIEKRVNEMLHQVGLYERADSPIEQLSGGEQQRVAIARALVHRPGLLIADEPTGNLDPELSEEIMNLLDAVNAQGTTVFVATHDHEMVRRRGKRVVDIKNGQINSDIASNESREFQVQQQHQVQIASGQI